MNGAKYEFAFVDVENAGALRSTARNALPKLALPESLHQAPVQGSIEVTRQVAFVRNVMVGRAGLSREVLLHAFRDGGAASPISYLATGNVSFVARSQLPALVQRVEATIANVIGRHEPLFIRTIPQLSELAVSDVFDDQGPDIYERCVTFLPDDQRWTIGLPLSSPRRDVTLIAAGPTAIFSVTRLVGGRPGSAGPLIERELGVRVTTRNIKTVQRILRLILTEHDTPA